MSREPSGFSRASRLRVVPLIEVNAPPTTILPSGCAASANTAALATGLNELSAVTLLIVSTAGALVALPPALFTTTA